MRMQIYENRVGTDNSLRRYMSLYDLLTVHYLKADRTARLFNALWKCGAKFCRTKIKNLSLFYNNSYLCND